MDLYCRLDNIKGIGPKRAEALGSLGLFTLHDLLYHFPKDYYDLREAKRISELVHGEYALVRVSGIGAPHLSWPNIGGRKTSVATVSISDGTGNLRLSWFNQPFRLKSIPKNPSGYVYGRVDLSHGRVMVNATFCPSPPGILPLYPLAKGLGQPGMRQAMSSALRAIGQDWTDTLPDVMRIRNNLCELRSALHNIHFPVSMHELELARRRLAFDDVLDFTILLEHIRKEHRDSVGTSFDVDGLVAEFGTMLPFKPTDGQLAIMDEIASDMAKPLPMNRLIQGDVGSGKTVLAAFAMFVAVKNGYQAALMAPTEVLARQHFEKLNAFFGNRCVLLTGNMRKAEREHSLGLISGGHVDAVIGTHAIIQSAVKFSRLGLVITDEQHRFGVRQRAYLGGKASAPDALIISATPIPRTLSLILYGDLDVSRLTELPRGRKPIVTRFVPPARRTDMYRYIERQVKERHIQAFVVCPLIEDSDVFIDAGSAESVFDELGHMLSISVDLLHGRMKPAERNRVMERFRSGGTDLLVSTTVIEVGVDVGNACIMVIESAEGFGLAQLHQLRGRVGRGTEESFCFLLTNSSSPAVAERIGTLVSCSDGFEIAQKDLETRGPGELLGIHQHGVSEISSAMLSADLETLAMARDEAIRLLSQCDDISRHLVERAMRRYDSIRSEIVIN